MTAKPRDDGGLGLAAAFGITWSVEGRGNKSLASLRPLYAQPGEARRRPERVQDLEALDPGSMTSSVTTGPPLVLAIAVEAPRDGQELSEHGVSGCHR